MYDFNKEEIEILESLGFEIKKDFLDIKEINNIKTKVEEMVSMYGYDDDAMMTELGEIYDNILDKINIIIKEF